MARTIPSPRRVRHHRTLGWWVGILAAFLLVRWGWSTYSTPPPPPERPQKGTEREAFVAFVFGKVSEKDENAISPKQLRAQLEHLKREGYTTIRLEDVARFYLEGQALPERPVLLAFEEAHRVTVELVDPILEELGMRAMAFVNVDAVASAHLDLVSAHHLGWMVRTGRWGVGVGGCRNPIDPEAETLFPPEFYRRDASRLESWTDQPALAASCHRSWETVPEAEARWGDALDEAGIPLGFVVRPTGPNYRDDLPRLLRAIRVRAETRAPDALVTRLEAYAPRREAFTDDFDTKRLRPAWLVDWGEAGADEGAVRLRNTEGDSGAVLSLGGTERWRDAEVEVEVVDPPTGQFWLYARRTSPTAFLRLGIVDDRVVLQKSDRDGRTRQVESVPVGSLPLRLRLRIIGRRANAFAGDRRLLDRPVELPRALSDGAIALVVWNDEGEATARIGSVRAEPIAPRFAIVDTVPGATDWAKLREEAEALHGVSPRETSWREGKLRRAGSLDLALKIFAHHHHVVLLPAMTIESPPPPAEVGALGAAIREEARREEVDGVHVILPTAPGGRLLRELESARLELAAEERELMVTIQDHSMSAPPPWMAWIEDPGAPFPIALAPLILTRPVPAG